MTSSFVSGKELLPLLISADTKLAYNIERLAFMMSGDKVVSIRREREVRQPCMGHAIVDRGEPQAQGVQTESPRSPAYLTVAQRKKKEQERKKKAKRERAAEEREASKKVKTSIEDPSS